MFGAVNDYLARTENSGLSRIVFVLRDDDAWDAFQAAIQRFQENER